MEQEARTIWSDEEVKCLIAVWGERNIQQQLDGAVRNKDVYVKISLEMQKQGYNRDWTLCRTKLKNLKQQYKKVKDGNNKTGQGRMTCKFFEQLDKILDHRPATFPHSLINSMDDHGETSGCTLEETSEEVNDGDEVQAKSPQAASVCDDQLEETDVAEPPKKKAKREKKSMVEKAMEKAFDAFAQHQKESEDRFDKREQERWEREKELEEKKHQEERRHQKDMLDLMAKIFNPMAFQQQPAPYDTYNFDYS